MRRRGAGARAVPVRVIALLLAAASFVAGCSRGTSVPRTIEVGMRYSRFLPAALTVEAGQKVSFVLHNADPISHEFVLGTAAEHDVHELGDPHDPHAGPGEAIVGPGETKRITYTFPEPGTLIYACHRAGHYRYGMRGDVRITG